MKPFSEQLSEYIRRLGISDAELARTLGVRRQTIFRWREGLTARPRHREDVLRLAEKLRLAPEERDALLLAAGFRPQVKDAPAETSPMPAEARPPSKHPVIPPGERASGIPQAPPADRLAAKQPLSGPAGSPPAATGAGEDQQPPDPFWRQRSVMLAGLLAVVAVMGLIGLGAGLLTADFGGVDDPTVTPSPEPAPPTPIWGHIAPAGPGETVILVTDFVNFAGEQVGYNVAGRLTEALEQEIETAELGYMRVAVWPEAINRRSQALQAGQTVSATLIIYGEYDAGRVRAQFAYPTAERDFVETGLLQEVADLQDLSAVINGELPQQVRSLALLTLGQIFISREQVEQAGQALLQAHRSLRADPQIDPQTWGTINFYLGIVYNRADPPRPDMAIKAYDEALAARPGLLSARLNRASTYHNRRGPGDMDRALADLERVIEQSPQWAAAYNNRAAILLDLGDEESRNQAEADLAQALELDPTLASAYINRAILRFGRGDPIDLYRPDVDKAIELEPERAGAWNMLCWGYAVEGKADLAMEFCEQAVALDPQPNVIDSRGLVHALLGNTEQAIADFEVFIDWLEAQPNRQDTLDERKAWVAALQAGEDPFTPDVLAGLRNQ